MVCSTQSELQNCRELSLQKFLHDISSRVDPPLGSPVRGPGRCVSIGDEAEKKNFRSLAFLLCTELGDRGHEKDPLPTTSPVPSVALCLTCRHQAESDAWAPGLASREVRPFFGGPGCQLPHPHLGVGSLWHDFSELSSLPREDARSPQSST